MNRKLINTPLLLILLLFLFSDLLFAENFRVRARQHFDQVKINYGKLASSEEVSGTGPTFNVWFEEPYHWAAGLLWGVTFLQNAPRTTLKEIGENMELHEYGFEIKYWMFKNQGGLFTRVGFSQLRLKTQGSYGELKTAGGQFSAGWEFKFNKIGLAFEVGKRELSFDHDIGISLISPAIGVHFYGYI